MADKSPQKSAQAQLEEKVLSSWQKENTFEKSRQIRKDSPVFSFYDGPPFANGMPHFGHSLVISIKDALGRYKTMQGFYVERRNGWDTHGLPVEFEIEKKLGVSGKKQILELGLDKFNQACRDSVFAYRHDHEAFYERIGRWADTAHAYATLDHDFTESVWWVMKQVHDKGLLYKGFKSLAYCPRCETPLSNFELNEGYKDDVTDPSLFVKFKLKDEDAYLLAWTTTPWSLPGNAAIAVRPEESYVFAKLDDESGQSETLVLAKKRVEAVLKDESTYEILREVMGSELAGKTYESLFHSPLVAKSKNAKNLFKVWASEHVDIEDGTGVLHVAPTFGEVDLELALTNNIPVLSTLDPSGHVRDSGLADIDGLFFKSADTPVITHLTKQGSIFAAEEIEHTYPFCYRCETPLLYYAIDTWFIRVSEIRPKLIKTAQAVNWVPAHIKSGRFGKWLEGARDWAVSRNRYWGAPMPIWVNEADPDDYIVVGSLDELRQLAGPGANLDDLHRPMIDEVSFAKDGKTYRRIEEVIDCWFESGSMPVAQQHYPFENEDKFDKSFPADYVGEGLDQTRLWFYVLHVIGTILFDKPAYKNVLVNGMILAADGQKLSKRLRNYPPLEEVFDNEGADSLRLYLLSNNQALNADYMRFSIDGVRDLKRNLIDTLLNSFRFFKMYADIDGWKAAKTLIEPKPVNVLDKWILARLNQTIAETTKQADAYKLAHAIQPIFGLIDDLSNWYIRRSRRRFWKSEDDKDKAEAYATLHFALVRISQLLAPWAPFVSDYLYRELDNSKSVHLSDWPNASKVDTRSLDEMKWARELINEGLRQRAEAGIKVRQPLAKLTYSAAINSVEDYAPIIQDELNVKRIEHSNEGKDAIKLNTKLTDELKAEGLMREIVRHIQALRKKSGLNVDDRITLNIESDDKLIQKVVKEFADTITQETLALKLAHQPQKHSSELDIDGAKVKMSLSKFKT